jgi:predicted dithiol-disulfide oxidoreductase (DUF899 family)
MNPHPVVSREEWLVARKRLLEKEKEQTRLRDRLAAERRALPWVKVEKEYVFDAPEGRVTLADLFRGRSQLLVKHFMLAPGQGDPCVGCSFEVDHFEGALLHLEHRDFAFAAVARAPIGEIEAVRKRMAWRFPFVSSYRSDFNHDFHVSFTPEEVAAKRAFYNYRLTDPGIQDLSGLSIFTRDEAGEIFHTYSTYARGGEETLGAYMMLDLTPKGRDERERGNLTDWVRLKDRYDAGGTVDAAGRYHDPACGCADAERQEETR